MSLQKTKHSTLKLDFVDVNAARFAVMHWHYSKSMPSAKLVKIGVWENGRFIGVVIFGRGSCKDLGKPYGVKVCEVAELTRVALTKHTRVVVSFADPQQKHLGVIYQAGNWIYTGRAGSAKMYLLGGRWRHERLIGSLGYSRKAECWPKERVKEFAPKYRYVYLFDESLRPLLGKMKKEYPKRLDAIVV